MRLTYDQLDRVDNYRNFSNTLLGDMNYDPMGNITKFDSVVGSAIHYTYNSSNKRLMSVSGYKNYAFSYDERGNIVDNGRDTLTYNLAGQVTSIGGYDYVYDAHNRRVKTIDTQGVRYSMYTLSGKLIHERINGANRENYYLGSQLVAHQGAGEKKYIHPDVLGGTAATTNAAKSPERTRYAPYGSAWGHTPKNEIGYTGHKQDSDTGLVYMQARYYDPVIGRFYSNDPIDSITHMGTENGIHGFNRYSYANNNPYKYVDPTGMCSTGTRIKGHDAVGCSVVFGSEQSDEKSNQHSNHSVQAANLSQSGATKTNAPKTMEEWLAQDDVKYGMAPPPAFLLRGLAGLSSDAILKSPALLRYLPQSTVKSILTRSGWTPKAINATTASRGGWAMQLGKGPQAVIQFSRAGGRHTISYWKISGPEIGTIRIPYFRLGQVPKSK